MEAMTTKANMATVQLQITGARHYWALKLSIPMCFMGERC